MKKKLLALAIVAALVAALVVPMAVSAAPQVEATGNVQAATVALTYTGTPVIALGMFTEGRNWLLVDLYRR